MDANGKLSGIHGYKKQQGHSGYIPQSLLFFFLVRYMVNGFGSVLLELWSNVGVSGLRTRNVLELIEYHPVILCWKITGWSDLVAQG